MGDSPRLLRPPRRRAPRLSKTRLGRHLAGVAAAMPGHRCQRKRIDLVASVEGGNSCKKPDTD
jgi:hypothetical protein